MSGPSSNLRINGRGISYKLLGEIWKYRIRQWTKSRIDELSTQES